MSGTAYDRAVAAAAEALLEGQRLTRSPGLRRVLKTLKVAVKQLQETTEEWFGEARLRGDENRVLERRIDELEEALARAVEDRAALLRRLGLSDAAWSAQGGACAAELDR